MKVCIHAPGSANITIPLPNALLFSPTLLDICLNADIVHSQYKMPEIPKETLRQICDILKTYPKTHGPLELVHVESASGATVVITI